MQTRKLTRTEQIVLEAIRWRTSRKTVDARFPAKSSINDILDYPGVSCPRSEVVTAVTALVALGLVVRSSHADPVLAGKWSDHYHTEPSVNSDDLWTQIEMLLAQGRPMAAVNTMIELAGALNCETAPFPTRPATWVANGYLQTMAEKAAGATLSQEQVHEAWQAHVWSVLDFVAEIAETMGVK